MRKTNIIRALVLVAAAGIWATPQARADFVFDLGTGNSAISGYSGAYAQVDVHLNSSTAATITFTSLTKNGNIYLLGDGGSVAVNVNAASWTLGTITGSNSGANFTPGPWSDGGAGNEDGFGKFNQTINSFDGYTSSSDTISFEITNASGTWSHDTDVLSANTDGKIAAAHIFVAAYPADGNGGALATGYAAGDGGGGSTQVPEPTTVLAGALLLIPFGASTLRILRKNR